jgi:GcrA cell cycle regulator
MREDPWTEDRVTLLQKWWGEGVTASAIAERLGATRSSVLGKIRRMRRLAAGAGPSKTRQSNTVNELASHRSPAPPPARRRHGKRGDQSESPPVKAKARGKRLMELTNGCCRWPLGNPASARFLFCGVPEANLELGVAYCRRHRERAYLKLRGASRTKKLIVTQQGEPTSAAPNMAASRASV